MSAEVNFVSLENENQDGSVSEKMESMVKKLKDREEGRKTEVLRRKEDLQERSAVTESTDYFLEAFEKAVNELNQLISQASTQSSSQLISYFDELTQKHTQLQKFLTDSSIFLSGHDLEKKQATILVMKADILSSRNTLLPKKKFAFKSKKKQTANTSTKDDVRPEFLSEVTPAPKLSDQSINNWDSYEYQIRGCINEVMLLGSDEVDGKDVVASKISHSRISIKGVPSAIHLSDISDSVIICGPCKRSIFIENCNRCTLVLACQQLRIHNAKESTFYIHVTSKAIIEDSQELKFASYNLTYDKLDDHFEKSGLNKNINNWAAVDDFNWLVKEKQSPNWSVLNDCETTTLNIE